MRLENAMVWWNDAVEALDYPGSPRIAVLSNRESNRAFSYLSNSIGACFLHWDKTEPHLLAAHLLAAFASITGRDGVPAADAHQEFMKIDEYREWVEEGTGPFADVYWSFGRAA